MRNKKAVLLAGIAAGAILGFAGLAQAQAPAMHTMTVRLPDGGIEQISYTGDVAPKVMVQPQWTPMPVAFGFGSPFAALEQISAQMDAMMGQMNAMPMMPMANMNRLMEAAAKNGGASFCSQSVQITSLGDGKAPKVVTHSAGNCAAAPGSGGDQANFAAAPLTGSKPIPIKTEAVRAPVEHQHI